MLRVRGLVLVTFGALLLEWKKCYAYWTLVEKQWRIGPKGGFIVTPLINEEKPYGKAVTLHPLLYNPYVFIIDRKGSRGSFVSVSEGLLD